MSNSAPLAILPRRATMPACFAALAHCGQDHRSRTAHRRSAFPRAPNHKSRESKIF